jgi:hypothetical protein
MTLRAPQITLSLASLLTNVELLEGAVNGVVFPPGSLNKTQAVASGLTDNGLKGGNGESCLTRRDPQLPSINVPGNGHSVSTELKMTEKTQS